MKLYCTIGENIRLVIRLQFFYTSDVLWSSTENYIQRKMKVSGLLKNKDKQVYVFAGDMYNAAKYRNRWQSIL